jgi:hypothetical protein
MEKIGYKRPRRSEPEGTKEASISSPCLDVDQAKLTLIAPPHPHLPQVSEHLSSTHSLLRSLVTPCLYPPSPLSTRPPRPRATLSSTLSKTTLVSLPPLSLPFFLVSQFRPKPSRLDLRFARCGQTVEAPNTDLAPLLAFSLHRQSPSIPYVPSEGSLL